MPFPGGAFLFVSRTFAAVRGPGVATDSATQALASDTYVAPLARSALAATVMDTKRKGEFCRRGRCWVLGVGCWKRRYLRCRALLTRSLPCFFGCSIRNLYRCPARAGLSFSCPGPSRSFADRASRQTRPH